MANPSDTTYALSKETVAGTTNANAVFLSFDHISGEAPQFEPEQLPSEVNAGDRCRGQARHIAPKVRNGLSTELKRANAVDLIIESALSGAFSSNVCKGGKTDTSFTIEKKMLHGGSPLFHRYEGCQATKLAISAGSTGRAKLSFEVVGMDRDHQSSAISGSTYQAMGSAQSITGLEVDAVDIDGLTAQFVEMNLTVDQPREPVFVFGQYGAATIGTSDPRDCKLTLKFIRTNFDAETLLSSDTPMAVSVDLGSGANGYRVEFPAATAMFTDNEDGANHMVEVTFTAGKDSVSGTDIIFTKLT